MQSLGMVRVASVVSLSVLIPPLIISAADAASKLQGSMFVSPSCGPPCPMDAVDRAQFKIVATNKKGANGILVKMKLVGATSGGSPISTDVKPVVALDDGTGCASFVSTNPHSMVDGHVSVTLGGADFTPEIAEPSGPGVSYAPCDFVAGIADTAATTVILQAGLHPGTDDD